MRYRRLTLLMMSMIVGIAAAFRQFEMILLIGQPCVSSFTWKSYWISGAICGSAAGLISCYLGGWWFDVRVGWTGGRRDFHRSQFLNLSTSLPPCLATVLWEVSSSMRNAEPIPFYYLDMMGMLTATVLIFMTFYSVFLRFLAVCRDLQARRVTAGVWFLALPAAYYLAVFAPFVIGFIKLAYGAGNRIEKFPLWLIPL